MRILVGTFEICRQLYDMADGFRKLGHEVDTVATCYNPFYKDLTYTYLIDQSKLYQQLVDLVKHPVPTFLRMPDDLVGLRHFLTHYDVYVFQFAHSLLPANSDFPILKQQGKKIISVFNGSDVRHWSAAEPVAEAFGYTIPEMCREEPYCRLNDRLSNLRMAERYADAIFSLPFQSELAVRPYWHFYLLANLSLYEHRIPARDVPVLVHAPSRRKFKGTDRFLAVLDQLREEGVRFELKLLEGVPNQQVIRELIDADVVLDELHSPHYAMLAAEGMATGCVVVAGYNRDYVPLQGDSPVYHVHDDMLYPRLKQLLTDKALRIEYARRGRPFVQQHHDHVKVAAHMLSKLEATHTDHDYYPSFVARAYQYPEGETVREPLKRLTAEIIQRYGLPDGIVPDDLVQRGLIDAEGLSPEKPVLHWRPAASHGVREQAWGWSPLADRVAEPVDTESYRLLRLIEQALDALDARQHEVAAGLLQQCIDLCQAHPDLFSHGDVLTALGRLAVELNQADMARALFTQALQADPARNDVHRALEALTAREAA